MLGPAEPLRHLRCRAMSLLELLVTMAVVAMLFTILFGVVVQSQELLQKANREVSAAQLSRQVFQVLREKLRHATLASTPHFFDSAVGYSFRSPAPPNQLRPFSQLSFVTGPSSALLSRDVNHFPGDAVFWPSQSGQVQLSGQTMHGMLEGLGCLVRYGTDPGDYPSFLQPWQQQQNRYRLILYREAPEQFVRRVQPGGWTPMGWYHDLLPDGIDPNSGQVLPLAQVLGENVAALFVEPLQSSGNPYPIGSIYNSYAWGVAGAKDLETTHGSSYMRLPTALRLGLVILSPASGQRLAQEAPGTPSLGSKLAHIKQSQDWEAELEKVRQQLGPSIDLQLHETLITLPRQP